MVWGLLTLGVAAIFARPAYNALRRSLTQGPSVKYKGGFANPMTRNEAALILGLR